MTTRHVPPCAPPPARGPRMTSLTLGMCMLVAAAGTFAAPARANLDLVFVLDTTASMSGELFEAKTRVTEIVAALSRARPGETIRTGVVAYRDIGDEYVTKVYPLTANVENTREFLEGLRADGGGDSPEDVFAGLEAALKLEWDLDLTTDRQVFLIADAPPHLDYFNRPSLDSLIADARKKRIMISAIGCRSLSHEGVAIFRKLSRRTEGSYQHIGRVVSGTRSDLERAILGRAPSAHDRVTTTTVTKVVYERRGAPLKSSRRKEPKVVTVDLLSRPERPPKDLEQEVFTSSTPPSLACKARVSVPAGLSITSVPTALVESSTSLVVEVEIGRGDVSAVRFALPKCVSQSAAVHLQLRAASSSLAAATDGGANPRGGAQ